MPSQTGGLYVRFHESCHWSRGARSRLRQCRPGAARQPRTYKTARDDNGVLRSIEGLSLQQLRQPERPGKWSIGQILQHFADSVIVWAWRMRTILAQARPQLTGYDQDLWAERLHYDQADPSDAIELFTVLRCANLRLVEGASN